MRSPLKTSRRQFSPKNKISKINRLTNLISFSLKNSWRQLIKNSHFQVAEAPVAPVAPVADLATVPAVVMDQATVLVPAHALVLARALRLAHHVRLHVHRAHIQVHSHAHGPVNRAMLVVTASSLAVTTGATLAGMLNVNANGNRATAAATTLAATKSEQSLSKIKSLESDDPRLFIY